MNVGQTSGVIGQSANPTSKSEMGKEDFLRLLTTQLSNQDPLNPMDNSEFASQLAQFSSVEQLVNISSGLEQLAMAQAVSNGTDMIGFIGNEVVYNGNAFSYNGETPAELTIDLPDDATKVTVSVYDESGKLVQSFEAGPMNEGIGEVVWDGTDLNGQPAPAGDYTFGVSAEDADGNRLDVSARQRGYVSGVTYENGYPELVIGNRRIVVGDVIEVVDSRDERDDQSPGGVEELVSK